jgi:ankyrin repeat protein
LDEKLRKVLGGIQESTEYFGVELVDVNQRGHFGNTPLKVAVVRGDIGAVRTLLDAGADVGAALEDGFSPLHHAAAQGHAKVVVLLLERGADPKAVNDDGLTPVELAHLLGQQAAVNVLESSVGGNV